QEKRGRGRKARLSRMNEQLQAHKQPPTWSRTQHQVPVKVTCELAKECSTPGIYPKPHPAMCHPGGSWGLSWLTFCFDETVRRASPWHAKTGLIWAVLGLFCSDR
ncbi:unnamed protein product, partial [Musa acuminata subsp. burmannicoides]